MKRWTRHIVIGVFAAIIAFAAMIALPTVNWLIDGGFKVNNTPRIVARVEMKAVDLIQPRETKKREARKPTRARPTQTNLKAGPRFAMDLGVAGEGGAAAPPDIVNKRSGGGGAQKGSDDGDVDQRPSPSAPPPFRVPDGIKSAEKDALLRMSFCVDTQGRPYEIRIVEEKPQGLGMAQAGREALQQTTFQPARKGGLPVAFCGLEQPFEVRFSN